MSEKKAMHYMRAMQEEPLRSVWQKGEMCREDAAISLPCSLPAILCRYLPEWDFILLAPLHAMWT